jgi:NADPH-dependent 2,4-dienoyl-CoA reductase/sulfur reductase-like enzyme/nitrite reductase/ring-hydroxylating ferredoxin subunit
MTPRPDPDSPDLTLGIAQNALADGAKLLGRVGDEAVLLVRIGREFFAVGTHCTHYGGPLVEGLVVGDTIRCPWHHACFDLRTGEALQVPAFDPLPCWVVELRKDRVFVRDRDSRPKTPRIAKLAGDTPKRIVIVGGGAAGFAAAEMLRRQDFAGSIVILSKDTAAPVDRPSLSKEYLSGNASDDSVSLRPSSFYSESVIDLRLATNVTRLDPGSREIALSDGQIIPYDRLLLATGAEPVRLWIPGADQAHVHYLRSLADCSAIVARAQTARRAIILGASFIGLEVAAALRGRGIDVHVVAPERQPLGNILGLEIGRLVRSLHEEHGVNFHLRETAVSIEGNKVFLTGGNILEGDLIIAGIGALPQVELAVRSGLVVDRGVVVNSLLETSASGVFAAGDIARWPDPHTGGNIRVDHWVVAERQGRTAALNMMGHPRNLPLFPSFGASTTTYRSTMSATPRIGTKLQLKATYRAGIAFYDSSAVDAHWHASIFRDYEGLQAELCMEEDRADALR